MQTEFALIFEEFDGELKALRELVTVAPEGTPTLLSPRARIAAGNAATLLLAAVFEEYVRQQVKAAFKAKAIRVSGIEEFPAKLSKIVWRQTMESMARMAIGEVETNQRFIEERFQAVVAFSIKKEILAEVSDAITQHENNMKSEVVTTLFSNIGISNIIKKTCADNRLRDLLNSTTSDLAVPVLNGRIEDFFRRRNAVAHAISLGSSSGPSEIEADISLFTAFGSALAAALATELPELPSVAGDDSPG